MRPGEAKYPHIFSPWKLKSMEVKNRIKYASTETNFNYGDGFVSDREVAYMEAKARGGAGHRHDPGRLHRSHGRGQGLRRDDGHLRRQVHPRPQADRRRRSTSTTPRRSCSSCTAAGSGGVELDYTVGPSVVPQRIPRFREPARDDRRADRAGRREQLPTARAGPSRRATTRSRSPASSAT